MYLLSDNIDTQIGLRLSGIEGKVIHTKEEVINEITKIKMDKSIGVLLITALLSEMAGNDLINFINDNTKPVVVVIPDRHGKTAVSGNNLMAMTLGIR